VSSPHLDRKAMHDGFQNRFSFVKDRKSIIVSLSPNKIYKDELKLGEDKRAEKESLYLNERVIQNIFFVDKVLQGFDDYKLFRPCNDDVLLVNDFHVLYLRLSPSK